MAAIEIIANARKLTGYLPKLGVHIEKKTGPPGPTRGQALKILFVKKKYYSSHLPTV